MKFKINLETLAVEEIFCCFENLAGISTENYQHVQLPGHALTEVNWSESGCEIALFHPGTDCRRGHVDLFVKVNKEEEVSFQRYQIQTPPIDVSNLEDIYWVWPTGPLSLIQVLLSIEKYLKGKNYGYLGFKNWMLRRLSTQFAPTPTAS